MREEMPISFILLSLALTINKDITAALRKLKMSTGKIEAWDDSELLAIPNIEELTARLINIITVKDSN
jgi:hypothetical protein